MKSSRQLCAAILHNQIVNITNMTIEVIKNFEHSCNTTKKGELSDKKLHQLTMDMMRQKGIDPNSISVDKNGNLQIEDIPNLKLHSIMLELEKLGVKMKYTKKTLIEIS